MSRIYTAITVLILGGCASPPAAPKPPHLVTTTLPKVADVPLYIDYTGHIEAYRSVSVRSQVSGEMVAQYFVEGQKAKKGDLLLVIDPRPYQAALNQAKGTLHETLAELSYAEETTERYAPLVQQEFISQLNYDQYVTDVLTREALIEQNMAELETAQINLGYCFIEAPMDCVTGKLYVKPGNYIDANADNMLTVLNQIQPIYVDFSVPESDLLTIQQRAKEGPIPLVIYPEVSHKHAFRGSLTLINNQVDTGTGAILLEGILANEEGLLWPGTFVDVRLIVKEEKGALLLPTDAVMVGQNRHYVFVVNTEGVVDVKTVKIGQRYDDRSILIESGITATDQVITEGQLNLAPGMAVQIHNKSAP